MRAGRCPIRHQNCSWVLLLLALFRGPLLTAQAAVSSPILVITNAADPFSQYYAQILLTEGLNEFALEDVSSISNATLPQYDVVLLGQTALTSSQVTTLSNWVNAGGNLIAMRPDKQLAGLLGLSDAGATLSEGYLLVNTSSVPGAGIVDQTIQFHGTADLYSLAGAPPLATLYSDAVSATANPAVTLQSVGVNGGQAAAFTFDLARSIVCTRQGNPAWAGQERDGIPPMRSDDMFFGAASFDPKPDYVDLNKVAIPQADEQQRLLANMIITMNADKKILPRFWYFPNGYKAVVVMTGDDHANGGTAGRFAQYLAYSPTNASVDDWTAIRGTSYIYANTPLTDVQASNYNAAGFEIALHLNTGCADYTPAALHTFFTNQLNQFTNAFPSLPPTVTHRIHCVAWSGYTVLPEEELRLGIRLDVAYYYWPSTWVVDRPGLFTGSGMPMRFATTNGSVIDVYQATSQMTDESGQSFPFTVDTLLDRALGPEEYYGAFVANMHTDYVNSPGSDAIINSARARGVPVISSRQLLTWLDARNGSSITSVTLTNNTLSFSVSADAKARGLQGMIPIPIGYRVANISYNGGSTGFSLKGVNGIQYAVFTALTGDYVVSLTPDTASPSIESVLPASGATGVSWEASVNVTFSEAMDESTINGNTIGLFGASNAPISATVLYDASTFTAVLTPASPLPVTTTYTLIVKGGAGGVADLAGNSMATDFASSFTTVTQISIWDNSTTPAILSSLDTSSVELGMKFESALAGDIVAIRFYKGPANTGSHVGNLWTTNGTLLASVTFTNETASGWQSQALAVPVAINSNTVYVVSYHAPAGGYSANDAYFAGSGVSNYPLRALANGESGGNGVFRYGVSAFPDVTFNSENYWVDVAFQPAVTVLTITTDSLPNGTPGVPYSATLTASAGTTPYAWSITSGFLPPGITLDAGSGAITGTPTVTGLYGFTAQVSDANTPAQIATIPLSITITALPVTATIWPNTTVPALVDAGPDSSVELGVKFTSDIPGHISSVRFYKSSANTGTHVGNLWTGAGTLLATTTFTNETSSGWQQADFATPVPISSSNIYVVSYHASNGHYSANLSYFSTTGTDNAPLHAPASGASGGNGVYAYGATSTFPASTFGAANYWVDVVFVGNAAPALPAQTNRTIAELTLLAVTNSATNVDSPSNTVTYSLTVINLAENSAVTNASISTNGLITWTPTEAQGPGTNRFNTVVTDNGVPPLSSTNAFLVTVNEVNTAPVLPVQTNHTLIGTQSLTVTNTATDADLPVNPLGYQLAGAPPGASIDANGIIRWTPAVSQVPGVYPFATVVTDTNVSAVNTQNLSATNSFSITVQAIHSGPSLPDQTNLSVDELTLLTVTNTAADNDIPALPLTYTLTVTNLLDNTVVTNAAISTNGLISWTPAEAQGPSTNLFTTVVSDNGQPPLSATNTSTVIVNEVNEPPRLPGQTNLTIDALTTLNVTNTATDPDIPANTLAYALLIAPTNAMIGADGVITWTPTSAQGGSTNVFTTVVTDEGTPNLGATNSFLVTVNPALAIPPPLIQSISVSDNVVTVTWGSVLNGIYRLQYSEDLIDTNWIDILPDVPAAGSTATATNTVGVSTQRFYRVLVVPWP